MKIKKAQKRKLRYILFFLVLVGTAGAVYYWYLGKTYNAENTGVQSPIQTHNTNYSKPTQPEISAGNDAKLNTVQNDQQSKTGGNKSSSPSPTTASFTTEISTHSANGHTIKIQNIISGVHSTGVCTLTLTKGSVTIPKSASVQALPQSSTCAGFDVTVPEVGTWRAHLSVTINGETAQATTFVEVK